jgi:hypothetical protein
MAALMAASGVLAVSAQNTNSGYFLDNYTYRYQLNPAFGNDMNFVSFPGLGSPDLAMRGNLHLTEIFHVVDGRTVLFTNPAVSSSVLDGLSSTSKLGAELKINLLSGGFKAWGGYNTVSVSARAAVHAGLPKSLFELAKEGVSNRTYDIRNLSASAMGYAEIALNHSRDIPQVPGLRAGAAMKFLVGLANFEADFREANLTLGENEWIARTNADIYANIGGLRYETDLSDNGHRYVSGIDMDGDGSFGPNGFGMAFDLGASYEWRDFNFSLGLLDLGWISYSGTKHASTNGVRTVTTDAYVFNADEDASNSFESEWDRFSDDLAELYQLTDNGDCGTRSVALGATLNVGVDYTLPVYRRLHFGLLSSSRFDRHFTWTEVRLSANVNPVDCFSADINVACGTFGASFGWMLNFWHRGFNIFLGMDHTPGKLSKEGIPLNSNGSFNFGINFPF